MSPHTSTFIESMKFSKSKWLTYTFFVGLIPVFTRLLAWAITHAGAVSPLAASDFVYFGLVLHISIINELEYLSSLVLFCRSINFLKSDDVASSFEVGVKMLNNLLYAMGAFGAALGIGGTIWSLLYTRKEFRKRMREPEKLNDFR